MIYHEHKCAACGTRVLRTDRQERQAQQRGSLPTCSPKCRSRAIRKGARPPAPDLDLTKPLRTRGGHVAVVEGRSSRKDFPLYGYVERRIKGANQQWQTIRQRERWRANGRWGEGDGVFELDLVVVDEEEAA